MTFDITDHTNDEKVEQTLSSDQQAESLSALRNLSKANVKAVPSIRYTVNGRNTGSFAGKGTTFMQIGPHYYGGEVQDIQIIESKAVEAFLGVRTNSDFLVDEGTGDANIVISMLFSGKKHIANNLFPLIALFRISPITSLRNEMISASLTNKFVDNLADDASDLVIERAQEILDESSEKERDGVFIDQVNDKNIVRDGTHITEEIFTSVHENSNFKDLPMWKDYRWNTYADFQDTFFFPRFDKSEKLNRATTQEYNARALLPKVPKESTDFVPVAFTNMEVSSHPNLSDTLIVRLVFKRVDVGAYTQRGLLYKTQNNTAHEDPRRAYWLRRMLDMYITRYMNKQWIFSTKVGNGESVNLRFGGDNIVLDLFKEKYELDNLNISSASVGEDSAILQMAVAYSNKFSFVRRSGTSFPTAQYMGSSSGTCSMSLRTNSAEKFEAIQSYKSAADFFVRTQDRLDRFNGWEISSSIVKMFRQDENPESIPGGDNKFNSAWYPIQVQTSTNPDHTEAKDISIVFKETNPNFFNDYGFTIYRKGWNLDRLRLFFNEIWDRAIRARLEGVVSKYVDSGRPFSSLPQKIKDIVGVPNADYKLDKYAHYAVFGKGNPRETEYCMVNPDTIAAAFYNVYRYNSNTEGFSPKYGDLNSKLLGRLKLDKKFVGESAAPNSWDHFKEDLGDSLTEAFTPGGGDEVELNSSTFNSLALEVAAAFFDNFELTLVDKINLVASGEDGRRDLYSYIYNNPSVLFSDEFRDSIFAVIARRPKPQVSEHQYNWHGLNTAFTTLGIVLEAKGKELLSPENQNAMVQTKRDETKIFMNLDGSESKTETATAYPDYFRVTYKELFYDVFPDDPNEWQKFSPTYQDFGIINADPDIFSAGADPSVFDKAQNMPIADLSSPVPPNVFFYHERKLNKEFREGLDRDMADYHEQLSRLRLPISFDIEEIIKDAEGRFDGTLQNDPAKFSKDVAPTLSRIIEDGMASSYSKRNSHKYEQAARLIVNELGRQFISQHGGKDIDDLIADSTLRSQFSREINDIITGKADAKTLNKYRWSEVSVPFLIGTSLENPVAKYEGLTSVVGEGMVRSILRIVPKGTDLSHFIDHTLVTTENGGVTISNANYDENKTAMLKITQRVADNSKSIMRAFPTMRLYLIDFVGPRIFVQDNFFGYHAINSIDITLDKNEAGLAVIRIADPFHILQGSVFGNDWAGGAAIQDNFVMPIADDETAGAGILDRIKIRPGRAIQIRGGYSSDPENLDILFTGRIAEVDFGDVVTVVAQDWKSELIGRSVEFELKNQNESSVKDLVVSTIQQASPGGMGQEYSGQLTDVLLRVGRNLPAAQSVYSAWLRGAGTANGFSDSGGTEGFSLIGGWKFFTNYGRGLDTRLRNIWVPDRNRSRWNYFADISSTGWESSSWVVPTQSAWEALQQATNYIWGYICQVVPYEGESTLFFGRPDQMYFHRDVDAMAYRTHQKVRAVHNKELVGGIQEIIEQWKGSYQYSNRLHSNKKWDEFTQRTYHTRYFAMSVDELRLDPIIVPIDFITTTDMFAHEVSTPFWQFWDKAPHTSAILKSDMTGDVQTIADVFGEPDKAFRVLTSLFFGFGLGFTRQNLDSYRLISTVAKSQSKESLGHLIEMMNEYLPTADDVRYAEKLQRTFGHEGKKNADIAIPVIRGAPQSLRDLPLTKSIDFAAPGETIYRFSIKNEEDLRIMHQIGAFANTIIGDVLEFPAVRTSPASITFDFNTVGIFNQEKSALRQMMQAVEEGATVGSLIDYLDRQYVFTSENSDRDGIEEDLGSSAPYIHGENSLSYSSILYDLGFEYFSKSPGDVLKTYLPLFKEFIHSFAMFLSSNMDGSNSTVMESLERFRKMSQFPHMDALNMKVFRDYHYINNYDDIIENNIAATTREMFNTIVVRYPEEMVTTNNRWYDVVDILGSGNENFDQVELSSETEWTTWPSSRDRGQIGLQFNPEIILQEKKVAVHTDLNVRRTDQAAKVGTNVLTKMMRPMYRNNLLVLGRPIKPWDVVYLKDDFVDMYGPIEVERVVHHYSVDKGWVTNIVPHAIVEANPGNRMVQLALFNNRIDRIFNVVDYGLWVATILTMGGAGLLKAGVSTATTGARFAIGNALFGAAKGIPTGTVKEVSLLAGRASATQALGKSILGNTTAKTLGHQLKGLGVALQNSSPAFQASFARYRIAGGAGAHAISRFLIQNAHVGSEQLPVVICPLIFKGAPLEAGMESDDLVYWSLSSKIHWAWDSFTTAVGDLWYELGNANSENSQHEFFKETFTDQQ